LERNHSVNKAKIKVIIAAMIAAAMAHIIVEANTVIILVMLTLEIRI